MQLVIRFLLGGLVVTLFAVLGDAVKPKSFAGLFSAAPSVAIAALGLALLTQGAAYAALEARSMIIGAFAFFLYACVCSHAMARRNLHAATASIAGLALWLGCALGGWALFLR